MSLKRRVFIMCEFAGMVLILAAFGAQNFIYQPQASLAAHVEIHAVAERVETIASLMPNCLSAQDPQVRQKACASIGSNMYLARTQDALVHEIETGAQPAKSLWLWSYVIGGLLLVAAKFTERHL